MNKKGFTLIELLGTIIILVAIALIAFPAVLNILNESQGKTDEAMKDIAIGATREYVTDRVDDFPKALESSSSIKSYGNKGNIKITDLITNGYISEDQINDNKNCEMKNDYVKVTSNSKKYIYEYVEVGGDSC